MSSSGERVGVYELGSLIGSGGMAEVFRARKLDAAAGARPIVVKRLFPHLARDPKFVQMFLTEARLCSVLDHPNIVPIFDSGVVDGKYFLAMELVDGCELGEIMRHARPEADELVGFAVAVVHKIALALAYAHDFVDLREGPLRIVHRDVSPTNVMLDTQGRIRLLDFGIAKAMASNDTRTLSGAVKGKAAYMSPQQARGLKVDHRADIFATGVILHELLTGRRLFKSDNDIATLTLVAEAKVAPPSALNPAVPQGLDAICLRALARNEDDRWQHARELADALAPYVSRLGWDAQRVAAQVAKVARVRAQREATAEVHEETRTLASLPSRPRPTSNRRRWVAFAAAAATLALSIVWVSARPAKHVTPPTVMPSAPAAPPSVTPPTIAATPAVPTLAAPPKPPKPIADTELAPTPLPTQHAPPRAKTREKRRPTPPAPTKKPATRIDLESARPPE